MKRAVKNLFVCALMLAAPPLVAEPVNAEAADIEMVKVVTKTTQSAACLAPVAVYRIDGETRAVPANGFLIKPGVHTINGRARLDTTKCHPIDADHQILRVPDLEVNFEFGNTYYIAYDGRSPNPAEWGLVVWKVEQDTTISKPLP